LFTGALAVEELSVVASIVVVVAEQQWALVGSADLAAADAAMGVLMASELSRGVAHATQLRAALALAEAQTAIGMELATVAQVALALGGSEFRAQRLLNDAQSLVVLPGAIEAIECGLLTVEQCHDGDQRKPPDRTEDDQRCAARRAMRRRLLAATELNCSGKNAPARSSAS
jgi:hypothetical protein